MRPAYEFIDHTADYAMRAWGGDFQQLLQNAAAGMIRLLADVGDLSPDEHMELSVTGDTREQVLVHMLKQLLLMPENGLVAVRADILATDDASAHVRVGTVNFDVAAERLEADIKAVTYHDLEIRHDAGGLSVQVVFDT